MSQNKNTDMSFVQKTKKDVWQTPSELWKPINSRDPITLDPCAAPDTNIGFDNYTHVDNGLIQNWYGTVWLNPPFSQKQEWLEKVAKEKQNCDRIYIVTPDSTDVQSWWHNQLADMCDWVWFSEGRINYIDPETGTKGTGAPFGTAINICGNLPTDVHTWLSQNGDLMKRV